MFNLSKLWGSLQRPHVHFGKRENLGKLSMTNSFALPNVKMFGMPKFYELFGESK